MDNLRRFVLIISLISFVLLCVGGFYIADVYDPKSIQKEVTEPTPLVPNGNKYDPDNYTKQDYYKGNTLFVLTPKEGEVATGFVLAGYNEGTADLNFIVIPHDLKVTDAALNNSVMTLGAYFFEHNAKDTTAYLSALLSVDIDNYITLSYDSLTSLIEKTGKIKAVLPMDIKFIKTSTEDVNYGDKVNFSKGEKELSGSDIVNILKFATDEGAYISPELSKYYEDAGVRQIHSKLATDIIAISVNGLAKNYLINPENKDKFKNAFAGLKDSFDTNCDEEKVTEMFRNISNAEDEEIGMFIIAGDLQVGKKVYVAFDGTANELDTSSSLSVTNIIANRFTYIR